MLVLVADMVRIVRALAEQLKRDRRVFSELVEVHVRRRSGNC